MVDTQQPPTNEERKEAIYASERARKALNWPTPCPTCLAGVGEPCMTRTGGRYPQRHKGRPKAHNENAPSAMPAPTATRWSWP